MGKKKIEQSLRKAGLRKKRDGRLPRRPTRRVQVTAQHSNSSSNTLPPSETAFRL